LICLNCEKKTKNPKFCSKSCSASYNNIGKRRHGKNTAICPVCSKFKNLQSKVCMSCYTEKAREKMRNSPISEYILLKGASRAKWNSVRHWARKEMEIASIKKECKVCEWDIYVEVCHIIPIQDFPESTLMKVVNSPNINTIYLCPNHHKMLDNNLLEL